jgi:hypothetical protein
MPQKKITFKPGVNQENTRYVTEGGWYDCDKVRFRQGLPEKIGGWEQVSPSTFLGICRSLWNWVTLYGENLLGVGTNLKFYVEQGGGFFDITPLRYQTGTLSLTDAMTTVNGSKVVTITSTGINLFTNDLVNIYNVANPVNGIPAADLNQQFSVTRIDADNFTIEVADNATSSGSGGGNFTLTYFTYYFPIQSITTVAGSKTVTIGAALNGCNTNDFVYFNDAITYNGVTLNGVYEITLALKNSWQITASTYASGSGTQALTAYVEYEINTGNAISLPPTGWGSGPWSQGTWGNGAGNIQQLQLWSQSNFGENLVFGPRGGGMYIWEAKNEASIYNKAYNLAEAYGASDVPIVQNNIVISDASRFVLALGCNDYGSTTLSPMLIRWSDQESTTMWTPSVTNQAGSVNLSHGSTIVGSIQNRQEIVVFTDSAVYSLQYLGPPAVWGSNLVGSNTSILGPNAVSLASGVVYWMGNGKFYTYNGTVQTLNCDLRLFIFNNINLDQAYQVYSGTNEAFNEVWWFYCSKNSTTIDTYVIYNYLDNAWYYGYLGRTAWLDTGLRQYPIAATYANNLVYHEFGTDDGTVMPAQPIDSYIQTSEFDIEDGDRFSFIWQLLPDVRFNGSNINDPKVTMSLVGLQNSGSGYNASLGGTAGGIVQQNNPGYVIEKFTGTVPIRVRGRQLIFRIEGNQLGLQWQLGAPRINIRADGRRGNT